MHNKTKEAAFSAAAALLLCGCSVISSSGIPEDPVNIIGDSLDGARDGKEQGLSAEDTTVKIIDDRTKEMGRLVVLSASSDMVIPHMIGDDYAKLSITPVNIIFTVDLAESEIRQEEDSIMILIPKPETDITVDLSKKETIAEYQKHFFTGSAEDGFKAAYNSFVEINNNIEIETDKISNYPELYTLAEEAAKDAVSEFTSKIQVNDKKITVKFIERNVSEP